MKRPHRNVCPNHTASTTKSNVLSRPSDDGARNHPGRKTRRRTLGRLLVGLAAAGGMLLVMPTASACDYCDSVEPDFVSCGCELQGCDTPGCDAMGCDSIGCQSCGGGSKLAGRFGRGGIFRALDAVAGGVEKVMGFDKCGQSSCGCDSLGCDSAGCDGGCSSMMSSQMMPMETIHMAPSASTHHHTHPPMAPTPIHSAPRMPSPPPMAAPRMAPRAASPQPQLRMSEPMIVSPQAEPNQSAPSMTDQMEFDDLDSGFEPSMETAPRMSEPRVSAPRMAEPRATTPRATTPRATAPRTPKPVDRLPATREPMTPAPAATPSPTPAPAPDPAPNSMDSLFDMPSTPTPAAPKPAAPKTDGGGLFDALDDPFGDDVRVLPRSRPTIQPSNYRRTPLSAPIRLQAPQARVRSSSSNSQHSAKAATQHRNSRKVASRSNSTRSNNTRVAGTTMPLRTGSSFRNLNQVATRGGSVNGSAPGPGTRQVSHQHSIRHTNRAAHSHTNGHGYQTPQQLAPAPTPARPQAQTATRHIQPMGQRHSTAGYSAYGHTTNRR